VRDDDGWTFRATPGLARGRSNHALPPCRTLSPREIADGVARAEEFAGSHGIAPGVQVSPLELHEELDRYVRGRGWTAKEPVIVMTAPAAGVPGGREPLELTVTDHADRRWLEAWAACEPARDVQSHVDTFARMAGRARFGRFGAEAVGIVVESDALAGLFCLAVAPAMRRRGLGSALVRGLLAGCASDAVAYLQVEGHNVAATAMYRRLGFEVAYRYRHCSAPPGRGFAG
jgi:ribosomal protein S18 acetylase RimI-like enzyme